MVETAVPLYVWLCVGYGVAPTESDGDVVDVAVCEMVLVSVGVVEPVGLPWLSKGASAKPRYSRPLGDVVSFTKTFTAVSNV